MLICKKQSKSKIKKWKLIQLYILPRFTLILSIKNCNQYIFEFTLCNIINKWITNSGRAHQKETTILPCNRLFMIGVLNLWLTYSLNNLNNNYLPKLISQDLLRLMRECLIQLEDLFPKFSKQQNLILNL